MPQKKKSDAEKTTSDPQSEAWIHSMSDILHIKQEDPNTQGHPNGGNTDHTDGPSGNGVSLEPDVNADETAPPEPQIPDLTPQIKKASTKFEVYKKRRNIFKDVRDLEIFDNYVKSTAQLLEQANDLNKQQNVDAVEDTLDNVSLTMKEIEKTYARGVASACVLVQRKQELADIRARLKFLNSFDLEGFSENRQREAPRLAGLVQTNVDKAEAQLKAGEIKASRDTFLTIQGYLEMLELTLKEIPSKETQKPRKEITVQAYTGDNSVAGAQEILTELNRLYEEQRKIPYTDKEEYARSREKITAQRALLKNPDHRINNADRDGIFTQFEPLGEDGKSVLDSGEYEKAGNKIHLSVQMDQLAQAGNILTPLLLSPDNPFLSFKVTNMDGAVEAFKDDEKQYSADTPEAKAKLAEQKAYFDRVTQGAQITLYPYAKDTSYPDGAEDFGFFLKLLEQELAAAGIQPGKNPDSDAGLEGLSFATFRNEEGSRGVGVDDEDQLEENRKMLRSKPFYQALTNKDYKPEKPEESPPSQQEEAESRKSAR
ncbi:phosphothreonine lyase [Pseudovibrio ascidiaceicola]|uniref:Phosphothreonine lyase n=1 Tax=Pseudovibrio ascidiaceicola TaxID=285279 RepID=A0A1I3ZF91_9HYPH|nr:virulence protein [Pseudovibrio ascidiaceicola]SFK42560.1 phosphothreonine lyase [Pseudovibrio ascidiaceicola]